MPIIPYLEFTPEIGKDVFIAPSAWVTGKVKIADRCSLFFGVVMRGDIQNIIVSGESAGGNLAAAVALMATDKKEFNL